MKTLLKYITLLIFGGVIIPLYQPACAVKPLQLNNTLTVTCVTNPVKGNKAFHFYFLQDAVAKLLPVADFFK